MTTTPSLTASDHVHTARCWWDVDQARWSCAGATPTSTAGARTARSRTRDDAPDAQDAERPLVDVRDMLVVHTALLRELRLAPAAVEAVPPGDRRRTAAVAGHVLFLLDLLHQHHEGEDALLWPVLRERTSAAAQAVIGEVEEQHAELDVEIAGVRRLRSAWVERPTPGARDALVVHLGHLHLLLSEHLDLEERALLPLAAAVLTREEWEAVGEAGAAGLRKADLPLVFGMFAYEGDPAVVRSMLAAAPRLVRGVLPVVARRAYASRALRVHGTSRP